MDVHILNHSCIRGMIQHLMRWSSNNFLNLLHSILLWWIPKHWIILTSYTWCILDHGEWSFACVIRNSFQDVIEYFCINICYGFYMLSPLSGNIRRCGQVRVYETLCVCGQDPHPSCLDINVLLAAFTWTCRTLSFSCTMPFWMRPCGHLVGTWLILLTCKASTLNSRRSCSAARFGGVPKPSWDN